MPLILDEALSLLAPLEFQRLGGNILTAAQPKRIALSLAIWYCLRQIARKLCRTFSRRIQKHAGSCRCLCDHMMLDIVISSQHAESGHYHDRIYDALFFINSVKFQLLCRNQVHCVQERTPSDILSGS
jgi:hypothetical protein